MLIGLCRWIVEDKNSTRCWPEQDWKSGDKAWVIALFLIVLGSVAITQLPISQYPPVAPPVINVEEFRLRVPLSKAKDLFETGAVCVVTFSPLSTSLLLVWFFFFLPRFGLDCFFLFFFPRFFLRAFAQPPNACRR